jgi:capsular exopolysaccharide synthesis family protein
MVAKTKINISVNVDNRFLEKFRILRTRVELIREANKILIVTSSLPGEGKTTVAMNLSRSLSDIGKKVIFTDCNLRGSEIAAQYEIAGTIFGIQSYLVGEKNLEEIILESDKGNLDFILSIGSFLNSTELLERQRFHIMLAELKKNYDYVIIDTPSMTESIDTAIIAREADAAIFVIEENRVHNKTVEAGFEQLREAKCEVLGVVLNKSV